MDITALNQKNIPVGRSSAAGANATEVDGLASQRNVAPTGRDGEKDNSVARDSATISTEALQLSNTASVKQATNQTQIPDRQKAQEAASNIISAIQSNPAQAKDAFANASPTRAANALAA
ncbi:hypothetical protein [Methylomonas rivi]|uniref:Uncharacterized protein n=1 Tax=Methylomonas rivi TaxID=2952226 RepID=A0ABT1TZ82_9GAMM|nr:hypothetical protein [Methylomonas sp. WSC-6]MBS4050195.1 hypothetical protein [Methylomonas sp.]MCQ8126872.1 hypothetical protein [Methylomonas sp. WSC-6]